MLRMTNKKIGILLTTLMLTQVQANAGWFSGFGNRIISGAVNTIKNNIQSKVNRKVDEVMDGKLASGTKSINTQNKPAAEKKNLETKQGSETKNTNSSTGVSILDNKTYTNERGKAIPYKNDYKDIDLGAGFEFKGENVYLAALEPGNMVKPIEEFLDPGMYLIFILARSYGEGITYQGFHEHGGIELGYGIQIKKRKIESEKGRITARTNGATYLVEVLPNTQGHLQVGLINSETLNESGELIIFKVPEGEVPKWLK